jgi:hypothetical protein
MRAFHVHFTANENQHTRNATTREGGPPRHGETGDSGLKLLRGTLVLVK